MSVSYTWVGWNRQKKIYDSVLLAGVATYLVLFVSAEKLIAPAHQGLSDVTLFIRALGTCAIILLHIILCIGPLARLDRRFLPLLYNRRHLGVTTFFVGLAHAVLSLGWYHGFGDINPILSLLTANTNFRSISQFPFELLGLFALVILFLMAATSHDFWLKNLSPRVWKSLHMLVYLAYALLVLHVALGVLQSERHPVFPILLTAGVVVVGGLHIAGGLRETRNDRAQSASNPAMTPTESTWIDAGSIDEIPEKRARTICLPGANGCSNERVAIFKYDGKISAVSNVCEHQGGPLGEGKIVDGCITCPWHGYQYLPGSGQSPPPFTEKIHTYQVRVENRRVFVNPRPLPKGTPVEPVVIGEASHA